MNKHEINTIINVEAKLDRTNDLKRQLEGISSAGKLLNDTKAFREASKGIEGITNQVRRLTKELDTLRSAQMQSAKSTQAKYGTSPRAGGFYLPQGKEILPFLERFSRAHGGLEQFQSHLARAVQQHAQTSQGQGRRTRRFHGQVAHLQQVAQAYYGQQRDPQIAAPHRAATKPALQPKPSLALQPVSSSRSLVPITSTELPTSLTNMRGEGARTSLAGAAVPSYKARTRKQELEYTLALERAFKRQEREAAKAAKPPKKTTEERAAERESAKIRSAAAREKIKNEKKRISENEKVDKELDEFERNFGAVAAREKSERRAARRGAFRQGLFQGIGGPEFLQRKHAISQVAGYVAGATLRAGGKVGMGAASTLIGGAVGGSAGMINAMNAAAGTLPFGLGFPVALTAGILGQGQTAAQRAQEFRRISNILTAESQFEPRGRRLRFDSAPASYLDAERRFGDQVEPGFDAVPSAAEAERRRRETLYGEEAKRYAPKFGIGPIDYLRRRLEFSRMVGKRGMDLPLFNTALAASEVTGLQPSSVAALARFSGTSPGVRGAELAVDRMLMSTFTQAVKDGLNKSAATGLLEELTQVFSRAAAGGVQSKIFPVSAIASSALVSAGLTPETAFGVSAALGQRTNQIAFGAKNREDLLFLRYFGGLDLSGPMSPTSYMKAVSAAASGENIGPKSLTRFFRDMINMGGGGDAGTAFASMMANRVFGREIVSLPQMSKIATALRSGDLTAATLVEAGIPTALAEVTKRVGDSQLRQASTDARVVTSGLQLIDAFTKMDVAAAKSVENLSVFSAELETVSDLMSQIGDRLQDTIRALKRVPVPD